MLPPERRLVRVLELITDRKYFTLHAGRQTGKTTSLMWLERHLNAADRCHAVWVDIQTSSGEPDPARAFPTILESIDHAVSRRHPDLGRPEALEVDGLLRKPATALLNYLTRLSELNPRPLVLLLDEVDGLVGQTMVSFLVQLRQGYINRSSSPFPSSVALVGQRQVRDYILAEEERRAIAWLGTASPFNVTAEATTLGPFTEERWTSCWRSTPRRPASASSPPRSGEFTSLAEATPGSPTPSPTRSSTATSGTAARPSPTRT